jgi:enoyl-CoA hydratase/3-hydroxyacyl-CoA dehydrogenase
MVVLKVAVLGAGSTGVAIARAAAQAGIAVVLGDDDRARLEDGLERLREGAAGELDAQVSGGRLTREQADERLERTLALLTPSVGCEGFGDADLALEALAEQPALKQCALAALDASTPGHAVLATSGSLGPFEELAAATTRPGRVVGFNLCRHPVSARALAEVVEGPQSAPDAVATALSFAAALRIGAIRCTPSPGLVVERVLIAALGELWRAQEEDGLSIAALDAAIAAGGAVPLGPFALAERIGLDAVNTLAVRLREAYGERFHVHAGIAELAQRGAGAFDAAGVADFDADALAERFALRALVESCLVVEEGVAGAREVDLALATAAGMSPPPLAGADATGLGELLARLEDAAGSLGERFAPPTILRRLVAQGRLGAAAGQGFFPSARPDAGQAGPVRRESRGEVAIAWLENPPANAITLEVLDALAALWREIEGDERVRALVIASANPALFCAGADIKGFVTMDLDSERELIGRMQELLLELGRSRIVTIAAVNGVALGGGCELAMGADLRIAARSASFGQPEIRLGIIPGFGGTQRLPRLVGAGRALELTLTGEPLGALEAWELGLVNAVVEDHELLDAALGWARRLAAAPPLAVAEIKRLVNGPALEAGIEAEKEAFERVFASADAREGIAAFLEKRAPRFGGM